jgi:hypothetical protein
LVDFIRLDSAEIRRFQGGSELSEGTSAKWIFDVEIEKLRAEVYFAGDQGKLLKERLRPNFITSFLHFPN